MKKNIILIYIHTFLSTFILYYICDTLFYIERGLTSSQYISFVGITFFIRLLFEIPFGIIADKYNKILFYNSFFYNILYMLAMIIGGYIGQKFGLIYTYYITIIPFIIDFIISTKALIILTLTFTAISFFKTPDNIDIPCSVKTYGRYFLVTSPLFTFLFKVPNWNLKF